MIPTSIPQGNKTNKPRPPRASSPQSHRVTQGDGGRTLESAHRTIGEKYRYDSCYVLLQAFSIVVFGAYVLADLPQFVGFARDSVLVLRSFSLGVWE